MGQNSCRCWPQSYDIATKIPNSWIKFSRMLGQPRNLRIFCPAKISHYTVVHIRMFMVVCVITIPACVLVVCEIHVLMYSVVILLSVK